MFTFSQRLLWLVLFSSPRLLSVRCSPPFFPFFPFFWLAFSPPVPNVFPLFLLTQRVPSRLLNRHFPYARSFSSFSFFRLFFSAAVTFPPGLSDGLSSSCLSLWFLRSSSVSPRIGGVLLYFFIFWTTSRLSPDGQFRFHTFRMTKQPFPTVFFVVCSFFLPGPSPELFSPPLPRTLSSVPGSNDRIFRFLYIFPPFHKFFLMPFWLLIRD